ncbi:insulinase family protein [Tetragenococcus halophilus]|uniref:Peptidase M16 family protein n=3 Tax=Tetragenococcus halophilus TaxID=51669 RepID=A0A2H6DWY2_TETHA|nr:pitrilysin family protein [Tetragenococcus halophilus]AOF47960.1 zinc protease [Tetragenococcus halophilus]AYW49340.1 insulinase family protein [Tetragenococcus halophilus]MCO7025854.1 insulinase family protein [Tetragenococcus halophilus]MCO8283482.1 insulinase family protein [Tetragenococcus halophilus]MCO8286794.1 insulinase family protein [Tetragenococcus halophilus]
MNKKVYSTLNEKLYTEVLDNGLTVFILPKREFHKTYGLFSTNYGSIDNEFAYQGEKRKKVPDGIAHFLEHKMFEKKEGDIFQEFGRLGASANAFTSFTKTSYLFSATDHIKDNLLTLLDFVQAPYFTPETVEKEKGIIAQEIQMYQDNPDWQLFFGLLQNLYPKHPLHIDIAGTVNSIDKITADDLYECYQTFYHPSNMILFVVGNIDPQETMSWVKNNQAEKNFTDIREIYRYFPQETTFDINSYSSKTMSVSRPKATLGVRGFQENLPKGDKAQLRFRTAMNLLLQLLLGNTSKNYLRLYQEGIIDDSFGFDFSLERSFHMADFSSDTGRPEEFLQEIEDILLNFANEEEVNEENLERLKKKMLGKYFQSLNSLEFIANQFTQDLFGTLTLFDLPEIIRSIQLQDCLDAGNYLLKKEAMARFCLKPEKEV